MASHPAFGLLAGRAPGRSLGLVSFSARKDFVMSRIFADNAQAIGNTPLVMINRLGPKGVTILAKIDRKSVV